MRMVLTFLSVVTMLILSACAAIPAGGALVEPTQQIKPAQPVQTTAAPVTLPTEPDSSPTHSIPQQASGQTAYPAGSPTSRPSQGNIGDEAFDQQLAQAIESKDYSKMQSMMGERFILAGWRSEGRELSPEAVIADMRQSAFHPNSTPAAAFGMDTSALLEGADPLAFFPPDAARAFYMMGLGERTTDEALVIVGRDPDTGRRYWKGLLVAFGGFRKASTGHVIID